MERFAVTHNEVRLQNVASKDATRHNICGVKFEKNLAIATNGHALAITKRTLNGEGPVGKIVDLSSVKPKDKMGMETFLQNGESSGQYLSSNGSAGVIDGQFPDWKQIVPKNVEKTTITFNLDLLIQIAKAIDAKSGKVTSVTLDVPLNGTSPIVVRGMDKTSVGIMMPMKVEESVKSPTQLLQELIA